jgi:glycopeptide antibiotics resistance protein
MMKSDRLVQRVFFGLTVLFIVFIIYASWTPGSQPVEGERKQFAGIEDLSDVFRIHDLRDIATNVLLYMPLGAFLALALARRKIKFVSPWLFAGLAVSLTMEVGQMFIGRHPDVVDLVTNSFGYALGYWLVVAGVRFYGLNPVVFLGLGSGEEQDVKTQSIAAFRFIYICIYALVALLPFDVSVSLSRIYEQLLPDDEGRLRIILDPGYHLPYWQDDGLKITLELLGLLPMAVLTSFLNGVRGRLSAFTSIYMCVLLAVVCEVCQLFIMSRTTDIVMVPIAVIAGILGWALVKVWFNLQHVEVASERAETEKNWRPLAVALVGYALIIVFFAWSPFRFETDLRTVAAKILHDSNLIPFKEHFETRSLSSAVDIVKEVGLFVPFGVLLAFLFFEIMPGASRWKVVLWTGVISGCFATFTELSQAVCIKRYIDITDIFLAGFGGLCGAVLLDLFRAGQSGSRRRH